MSIPRVVLAGAGSGVGKTVIAAGLMARLSKERRVQGFKVGPDFIDPMFHTAATGRPSRNLDSFLLEKGTLQNVFGWASKDADISIVEGVRGLYDGLTSTADVGSTAEIAKYIDAPVILIVNARSLAKSAAAHVLGFKMLDPTVNIKGVILNHISNDRHEQKAVEAVESLTGTEVIGVIRGQKEKLPERHLGLHTLEPHEAGPVLRKIEDMVAGIDLDRLLAIAESAPERHFDDSSPFPRRSPQGVRIAVPKDKAYCFYYPENLEALKAAGAEIVHFRPADGEKLPDADAIYLGGGYPELYLYELSTNHDFLEGVKQMSLEGRVVYGECGGLMTLCRAIDDGSEAVEMVGVFDPVAMMAAGRQGPTYVRAKGTPQNLIMPGREIRAHEFHYSQLSPAPPGPYAYDVSRGIGFGNGVDGAMVRRTVGTYMHQHALSSPGWGEGFVNLIE
ncbi:cobyrinate a,c-diamide synthase [Methanomassiliicoccus luminyensis]|uniref:cobyrinate a,c-diamide synthase n=1 Tax=Methanomassiliicoccus luminyensis TaxID=1080712 RepID=UPI0003631281|nr:cobyrinate a,c-diamide synthase [Methanomassiliicoccus luminyensis]